MELFENSIKLQQKHFWRISCRDYSSCAMDSRKLLFPLLSLFVFSLLSGQGSARHQRHFRLRPTRLFVFGDSYVDTGNINLNTSSARKFPYGITFPGKPSGRFSDGRVLTDYFARYFGLKSPLPYNSWKKVGIRRPRNGINFAFGGTGVFDTLFPFPNMTTQIDFFQKLIASSVFTPIDIRSSIALVSVSGNDYSFYLATNGSAAGFEPFIVSVVNQIAVTLKRIHSLGVKKVAVTGLGPLGCLPEITAPLLFKQCNATMNALAQIHNVLLKQAVEKLNNETKGSPFYILDIYGTVSSIIQNKGSVRGRARFETPLKPCCFGVSSEFSCGSVDKQGNRKYTLCKDPKSALFWDTVHPTQEGWAATFGALKFDLKKL